MYLGMKTQNTYKNNTMVKLLGCSFDELKDWLERQFREGMSWENYGRKGWHIDHIVPCCHFDLTKIEEQKQCFNYKNLRPLWTNENLKKAGQERST